MAQAKTRKIRLDKIIKRKAFQDGFKSARRKEGWTKDYDKLDGKEQWDFERGRMLGVIAPNMLLMIKGEVSEQAIAKFSEALTHKWII